MGMPVCNRWTGCSFGKMAQNHAFFLRDIVYNERETRRRFGREHKTKGWSLMNAFLPANILIPQVDSMEKWAVIACDQFTSDPAYWARVAENRRGRPLYSAPDSAGSRAGDSSGGSSYRGDQPDHGGLSGQRLVPDL